MKQIIFEHCFKCPYCDACNLERHYYCKKKQRLIFEDSRFFHQDELKNKNFPDWCDLKNYKKEDEK